jgi:hypothetical protein
MPRTPFHVYLLYIHQVDKQDMEDVCVKLALEINPSLEHDDDVLQYAFIIDIKITSSKQSKQDKF